MSPRYDRLDPVEKARLRRRAALQSVHFHSQPAGVPLPRGAYRPMSLAQAVATLAELPLTHVYRRRASLQLVHHRDRKAARHLARLADIPLEDARELFTFDDSLQRQRVLRQQLGMDDGVCMTEMISSKAVWDPQTLVTTVTVDVRTTRSIAEMRERVDPRFWAVGSPDFFRATYAVQEEDGSPVYQPGRRLLPVQSGLDTPLGSPWSGLFYEDFEWSSGIQTVAGFRNVLNIDFQATDTSIDLEFSLFRSLASTVGPLERAGGLDVDSGFTRAHEEKNEEGQLRTRISSQKSVRFTDLTPGRLDEGLMDPGQYLNYLAPSVVGTWMSLLVYEGPCAEPPKGANSPRQAAE